MIIYNGTWKVYAHINKANGKIYIGITGRDVNKRWKNGRGYIYNVHFWKAINKYGWNNFEHEIIASNLTEEEAKNMEIILINKLNTTDYKFGYNEDKGGGMPPKLYGDKNPYYKVAPTKAIKASIISRTGKSLSEEHKKKISNGCLNKNGKYIMCIETNIIYPSLGEVERTLKINRSNLCNAVKNGNKCGGFHWKYVA